MSGEFGREGGCLLINSSNHANCRWNQAQKDAVECFGPIADLPFPVVDAHANEAEIERLSEVYAEEIQRRIPDAVLCQGELGLTYAVVSRLLRAGIRVIYACAERRTTERIDEAGRTIRVSQFDFIRFRDHQ